MASRCFSRGGSGTRIACFSSSSSSSLGGMPPSSISSASRGAASPFPRQFTHAERTRTVSLMHSRRSLTLIATPALPGDGNSSPSSSTPSSSSADNSFVGGLADAAKRLARTAQGGLPIVGLLSRLAAPGGGVGWDELAYPEFARALVDADASGEATTASTSKTATSFLSSKGAYADAVLKWQERHGRMNGQARYVNLYLWMAFSGGGGLVPARLVVTSARRLAVTQDIEIEVERFDQARSAALKDLRGFGPRPRTSPADQVALAVDALARLSCGLPDGAPLDEEDARLLEALVPPALAVARRYSSVAEGKTSNNSSDASANTTTSEDAVELVRAAVASRAERAKAYE